MQSKNEMINSQNNRRQNQRINQHPLLLIHHINSGSQLILVINQLKGIEESAINWGIWGQWFVNEIAYTIFGEEEVLFGVYWINFFAY